MAKQIQRKTVGKIMVEDYDDGSRKYIHPSGRIDILTKAQLDADRDMLVSDRDALQALIDQIDSDKLELEDLKNG